MLLPDLGQVFFQKPYENAVRLPTGRPFGLPRRRGATSGRSHVWSAQVAFVLFPSVNKFATAACGGRWRRDAQPVYCISCAAAAGTVDPKASTAVSADYTPGDICSEPKRRAISNLQVDKSSMPAHSRAAPATPAPATAPVPRRRARIDPGLIGVSHVLSGRRLSANAVPKSVSPSRCDIKTVPLGAVEQCLL